MDPSRALAQLRAREPIFHRGGCATREQFLALTAPDFFEVGASGRRYDREYVWSVLESRLAGGSSDDPWRVDDFEVREIAPSTYLATYLLAQGDRRTRRVTAWRFHDGRWMILYHQGTITQ